MKKQSSKTRPKASRPKSSKPNSSVNDPFSRDYYLPEVSNLYNPKAMVRFRQQLAREAHLVCHVWPKEDGECPGALGKFVLARLTRIRGEMNRAIFKVGMLDAVSLFLDPNLGLEWVESSVPVLLRELDDMEVLAYCGLAATRYAAAKGEYALALRVGADVATRVLESGHVAVCVPELQRTLADVYLESGCQREAHDMLCLTEISARRVPDYMPELWNRIYRSWMAYHKEAGDLAQSEYYFARENTNKAAYSELDNSPEEAEQRLMWFKRKPAIPKAKPKEAAMPRAK